MLSRALFCKKPKRKVSIPPFFRQVYFNLKGRWLRGIVNSPYPFGVSRNVLTFLPIWASISTWPLLLIPAGYARSFLPNLLKSPSYGTQIEFPRYTKNPPVCRGFFENVPARTRYSLNGFRSHRGSVHAAGASRTRSRLRRSRAPAPQSSMTEEASA